MKFSTRCWRWTSPLLILSLWPTPLIAQQHSPGAVAAPHKTARAPHAADVQSESSITFDTLLAADDYAIYGELRMLGQQVTSREVTQMSAPLRLPGNAPKEMIALIDFITAHAEVLTSARLLFGAAPARAQLPDALVAVELPSPEAAQKLLPELRDFLAANLAPPASPIENQTDARATTSTHARRRAGRRAQTQTPATTKTATTKDIQPPASPFHIRRAGNLLAISEKPFTFAGLRQPGDKLLTEETGFQMTRSRLNNETLFLYFNLARLTRSSQQKEEEFKRRANEIEKKAEAAAAKGEQSLASDAATETSAEANVNANTNGNGNVVLSANVAAVTNTNDQTTSSATNGGSLQAAPVPVPEAQNKQDAETEEQKQKTETEEQSVARARAEQFQQLVPLLLLGGLPGARGGDTWPEAIGVAAALEGEALVMRALFVNKSDDQTLRPIPFAPIFVSGPALTPEAANVLPADTQILVNASLDLSQMYDYVASRLRVFDVAANASGAQGKNGSLQSQLDAFEKEHKFRIKEDLLAALGNEIAISVPPNMLGFRSANSVKLARADQPTPQSGFVFVLSLNDKKALQDLLPRALESIGLKGVGEQDVIEKRGEVEVLKFAQGTLAFIDRFLVVAPDAATMNHIVDAYNNRATLASSENFRSAISWQPQQMLGQIYVSNDLLKGIFGEAQKSAEDVDDLAIRYFVSRINPEPGAITHVVTRDGAMLMHELHLPKNLLALASADMLVSQKLAPMRSNELQVGWKLRELTSKEESYKKSTGRYGTLDDLRRLDAGNNKGEEEGSLTGNFSLDATGYNIKLDVSGDKFAATATPADYRKTGRQSFYIDQTGILRGGDLNGKPASASDNPVD